MNLIRPFNGEYEAIAAIRCAIQPDDLTPPQTIQSRDARLKPGLVLRRLVAEQDGKIVGSALFHHSEACPPA
jgi:hypothetical protein